MWIFPGWFFQPDWWNVSYADCSAEVMRDALEHSLGFLDNSVLTSDPSRMLVSNKVRSTVQLTGNVARTHSRVPQWNPPRGLNGEIHCTIPVGNCVDNH